MVSELTLKHKTLPFTRQAVSKQRPSLLYYGYEECDDYELPKFESRPSLQDFILKDLGEHTNLRYYGVDLQMPFIAEQEGKTLACRETPDEFEAINEHFSTQVHAIFNALKSFQDASIKADRQGFYEDGLRLHVNDAVMLPSVLHVTKLCIFAGDRSGDLLQGTRPAALRVLVDSIVRLPQLQKIDCPFLWERTPITHSSHVLRHYTRSWEGPWRDSRHGFGRAVEELHDKILATLRKAKFWFWEDDLLLDDQSILMPNLVYPADEDPVSVGLRTIASSLEELELRAFLTPSLFMAPVQWSRMKYLRVEFHPYQPNGSWYFVGPRGENPNPNGYRVTDDHYPPTSPNEEDEQMDEEFLEYGTDDSDRNADMFRTKPLEDSVNPLLVAFAAALKGMPTLEEAELFTHLRWAPSGERSEEYGDDAPYNSKWGSYRWGIRYIPGKNGAEGLVEWQVGTWRPQKGVIQLFEELSGESEVKMAWKSFDYENSRG